MNESLRWREVFIKNWIMKFALSGFRLLKSFGVPQKRTKQKQHFAGHQHAGMATRSAFEGTMTTLRANSNRLRQSQRTRHSIKCWNCRRQASLWLILRVILPPIVAGMYHCWYAESILRSHIVYVYVNQAYNAAQLCLGPLLEDVAEIFTITDRSFGQKLHVWNCNS